MICSPNWGAVSGTTGSENRKSVRNYPILPSCRVLASVMGFRPCGRETGGNLCGRFIPANA